MAVFSMDVDLIPKFDQKKFDSDLNILEKKLRSLKSGSGSSASALASRLIQTLISSGQAATPTQARMILTDLMGGGFNRVALAKLRTGQNQAQITLERNRRETMVRARQERQEAFQKLSEKQKIDDLEKRAYLLGSKFSGFTTSTSESAKSALLDKVTELKYDLDKILQEYKGTNKKVPDSIKKIEKDTKKLSKGIKDFQVSPRQNAAATAFGSFFGNITNAINKLIGAFTIQKFATMAKEGIAAGEDAITEQSIYGENRDIALSKTWSNLYGISEKAVADFQRYAIMLPQRIKTGQVQSVYERLWLQELGDLGNALITGEAAANPRAAFAMLVAKMNSMRGQEAKMQQLLTWGGQNPELMKMTSYSYTPEAIAAELARQEEIVTKEKYAAKASMAGRATIRRETNAAKAAAANLVFGWWSADAARNLQGLSEEERQVLYENATPRVRRIMEGKPDLSLSERFTIPSYLQGLYGAAKDVVSSSSNITNNNEMTINIEGGNTEEVKDTVLDAWERMTMGDLNNWMTGKRKSK